MSGGFGSARYAEEELKAGIGSAFLSNLLNIPSDIPNHASYSQNWLKPLANDKRMIFRAAAEAQRGVDFLMDYLRVCRRTLVHL